MDFILLIATRILQGERRCTQYSAESCLDLGSRRASADDIYPHLSIVLDDGSFTLCDTATMSILSEGISFTSGEAVARSKLSFVESSCPLSSLTVA